MLKLNIGCGPNKLPGYVNIDSEEIVKPDLMHDIMQGPLPYEDGTVDEIVMFHCIEHIIKRAHETLFRDFWRVLKPVGSLYLSYPNFEECVKNWQTNKNGMRKFWEATIYGRQAHDGDYHVCAITPDYLAEMLLHCGFLGIVSTSELGQEFNSITFARKTLNNPISYDELIGKETAKMTVEVR